MQFVHRISKAVEIAAASHQLQLRKGSALPYITHPYSVAMLLLQAGCSENVVIAGLLHDTVEDTDLTLHDIAREFGIQVAQFVEECTEPEKSKSWEERKLHSINKIQYISKESCMIICCDKLHNIKSTSEERLKVGEKVWERFNRGKEEQKWYYRSMVAALEGRISDFPLFPLLQQAVNDVFQS